MAVISVPQVLTTMDMEQNTTQSILLYTVNNGGKV